MNGIMVACGSYLRKRICRWRIYNVSTTPGCGVSTTPGCGNSTNPGRGILVPLWLAILFLSASCGGDGRLERLHPEENVLRIAVPSDPRSLDPAIAYDVVTWPLVRTLFHGLIDYDDDLNLVPWHARSWTISEDGRTITFKLRQDIRFSNGRPITSEDFAYSLQRILNPAVKSPGQGFYRNIAGARGFQDGSADRVSGLRTPDLETFEIELVQPDLPFLYCIAMPFAYAVPREEVERHGDEFGRYPVGSGPFTLARWQRGTGLRLEKNPGYYRADDIRLEAIDLMVGGDETLHMMMFERGELDIASVTSTGIPDADFIRVMNDPVLSKRVAHQPLNAIQYLSMNTELPPFDNVNVRRAVNHAIDRERIVGLISDRGIPARGVLPPGMPGFNEALTGYDHDPEKARTLLEEAGFTEGFTTELMVTAQSGIDSKIGQAVQQDLAEVGITVEIRPVTGPTRIEATGRRGAVPFATFGWYQDYPDPSNFLDVLLNGNRITEVHSTNVAFYDNERVNALLNEASSSTDQGHRLALYQEAERLIVDDAPWVFLYYPQMYLLRQPWLKGLKLNPVWPIRYELMWIEP